MQTVFRITDEGIIFVPRFVKQVSDMEYGSVVTHENYNEKLNLNTTQGDYNTEILRLLFTDANPAHVPHIKYLDKIITDEVNRIDGVLDSHQEQITENRELIDGLREDLDNGLDELSTAVTSIINGVTTVGHALQADKITGIDEAGVNKYYGTDKEGSIGFHIMPPALYAQDMSDPSQPLDGIYFTPRPDSVAEGMLTPELRTKINRETISDYDLLTNRPRINGTLLTGDVTLAAIGAQPAGNYLTSIPSSYATDAEVAAAIAPYLLSSTAASTYATISNLNSLSGTVSALSNTVTNNQQTAEGRYARVCINTFSGTPKTGDILITL